MMKQQSGTKFNAQLLHLFINMLGIYPHGTVVDRDTRGQRPLGGGHARKDHVLVLVRVPLGKVTHRVIVFDPDDRVLLDIEVSIHQLSHPVESAVPREHI